MGAGDIGDHRHLRARQGRRPGDLAEMIGAQLDHAVLVGIAQAQQRHRQAEIVVEVAVIGEAFGLETRGIPHKDGMHQALDAGLAAVAGHRDQRPPPGTATRRRQQPEGQPGIRDDDLRQRIIHCPLDQRRDGTIGASLGEEVMGIEALTLQRHEQRCGLLAKLAGIRLDGAQRLIAQCLWQLRPEHRGQFLEGAQTDGLFRRTHASRS